MRLVILSNETEALRPSLLMTYMGVLPVEAPAFDGERSEFKTAIFFNFEAMCDNVWYSSANLLQVESINTTPYDKMVIAAANQPRILYQREHQHWSDGSYFSTVTAESVQSFLHFFMAPHGISLSENSAGGLDEMPNGLISQFFNRTDFIKCLQRLQ